MLSRVHIARKIAQEIPQCKARLSLPRVSVAEKIEDDRENVRAFLALLHTLIMIIVTVMMMKDDYKHIVLEYNYV